MIIDLKRYVDLKWLLMYGAVFSDDLVFLLFERPIISTCIGLDSIIPPLPSYAFFHRCCQLFKLLLKVNCISDIARIVNAVQVTPWMLSASLSLSKKHRENCESCPTQVTWKISKFAWWSGKSNVVSGRLAVCLLVKLERYLFIWWYHKR